MPPTPKKPVLRASQVSGREEATATVPLAVAGDYPEEYENESDVWKAGYDVAANTRGGHTVKGAIVFANNYQGEELSNSEIEVEIARLEKIQAERGGN